MNETLDAENRIKAALSSREQEGRLRRLSVGRGADFCSNDYLGFARSGVLQAEGGSGSTGSRLISGNSELAESLEAQLARFHGAEAALLFTSGYSANVGLLSAVPGRGDAVFYDELVHASIRDGIRLSFAKAAGFRHNDISSLAEKMSRIKGRRFVVVESLYSMDGDFAPLRELAELCEKERAALIVDEAHATGVYGTRGEGLTAEAGLCSRVFARVHTFGKALGCHGAAVVGSRLLCDYLINFSRPFIYTTALPPHALMLIQKAYQLLPQASEERRRIRQHTVNFMEALGPAAERLTPGESQIRSIICPGNHQVRALSLRLQAAGYDVRPVLSPTVPAGTERIRICLHSFNTDEEISGLAAELREAHELRQ